LTFNGNKVFIIRLHVIMNMNKTWLLIYRYKQYIISVL